MKRSQPHANQWGRNRAVRGDSLCKGRGWWVQAAARKPGQLAWSESGAEGSQIQLDKLAWSVDQARNYEQGRGLRFNSESNVSPLK